MKKALKVVAIVLGSLFVVCVIGFFVFIKSLPSTWQIKQAIRPHKAQNPELANKNEANKAATLPDKSGASKTQEQKADEGKELADKALHEDFLNDKKPLVSVCNHLSAASESHFLRGDESASSLEFTRKLTDDNKDPLVESAAPLFRYVLRLNSVKDLLEMIDKSQSQGSDDLMKKAEFYAQLGFAAQEIRSNKPSIDRLLMKSYNMYILTKAVGKHPELANDPATLGFCEQMEKNINMNSDFNPDQQSQELEKFLDYAKIDPKEVDYDPNYRSDVQFKFDNNTLQLNKIWLEKLFAADMRKAEKEIKNSPSVGP